MKPKQFEWDDDKVKEAFQEWITGHAGPFASAMDKIKDKYQQPVYPEGIVSFKAPKGEIFKRALASNEDYQEWVSTRLYFGNTIHTIRNSKGEEFSIGDTFKTNFKEPDSIQTLGVIERFIVDLDILRLFGRNQWFRVEDVIKPTQPIFTTEDRKQVEDDEIVWIIDCLSYTLNKCLDGHKNWSKEGSKVFFSKSNAETWIEKNKPKFSEQQILDICKTGGNNHHIQFHVLKQKLGIT